MTVLRREAGRPVNVRDVYAHPPSAASRRRWRRARRSTTARVPAPERPCRHARTSAAAAGARRGWTALLQALSIYLVYGIALLPFAAAWRWLGGTRPLTSLIGVVLGLTLLTWPFLLLLSVAAKWLIIGRFREGSYPLWGSYYFRWWLVGNSRVGSRALAGTHCLPSLSSDGGAGRQRLRPGFRACRGVGSARDR